MSDQFVTYNRFSAPPKPMCPMCGLLVETIGYVSVTQPDCSRTSYHPDCWNTVLAAMRQYNNDDSTENVPTNVTPPISAHVRTHQQ